MENYTILFTVFLVFLMQFRYAITDPIIELPNGKIQGRESITLANKTYFAFEGIPYAAPPTGKLRFKPPQPAPSWDGIRDCTKLSVICFQTGSDSTIENEDCLIINIFTPHFTTEKVTDLLPVMLFIHGGGFVDGDSFFCTPDLFINNNVILATIQYRVGIFGFLSTQDKVIPGNYGLKDQQFAIQWVHDNIHLFGGDSNRVTIFGQSAGSASVAYQLLNQKSQDLFQSAILESGSFLSPWAYQRRAREIAFKTASFINSTFESNNDSQALLDYLLTLDARDLDQAAAQFHNFETGPQDIEISQGFYFAPVVEEQSEEAFLTKKMYGLLNAGNIIKVPILIGVTSEENLVFNTDPKKLEETMETFDEHLDWIVPNDMQITDIDNRTEMGRLIRDLYTGGDPLAEHLGDAVRYSSDTSFTRSVIRHAELYSQFSETYFYIFSYDGDIPNFNVHYDGAENVAHGEEVLYLFCSGTGCDDSGYPELDRITRQRLIKIWTDFAKYQNPTPESSDLLDSITWPLFDEKSYQYVDIGENLTIKSNPKENTYKRWIELYNSLSFDDFDTY